MASNITTYHVVTRYEVKDLATQKTEAIGTAADRASRKTSGLKRTLIGLGSAAALGFGVRAGAKALVGFNSEVEQAKIQIAGLLQLNVGGAWAQNISKASDLFGSLQMRAKASVGTTREMVQMASMIVRPVTAAGLGMKQLEDITAKATVAAKAFGIQAEVAALDIEQALMGTLGKRERFARALIEPMGFTTKSFNKLEAGDRAKALLQAFKNPAIGDMAKAQEQSFAGVTSTLVDNLQLALGKVGLPLMQRLTAEVKQWNTWIDANGTKIDRFATRLADSLVSAFGTVKDIAEFFVDHSTLLLTVAKAFVAFKVGRAVGNTLTGVGKFMAALSKGGTTFGEAADAARGLSGSLGTLVTKLGKLGGAIGLVVTVAHGAYSVFKERRAAQARDRTIATSLDDEAKFFFKTWKTVRDGRFAVTDALNQGLPVAKLKAEREEAKLRLEDMKPRAAKFFVKQGFLDEEGKQLLDKHALREKVLSLKSTVSPKTPDRIETMREFLSKMGEEGRRKALGLIRDEKPDTSKADKALDNVKGPKTEIHIHKVEVAAADPDRFLHAFGRAVERFNRAPTQAVAALRGGL